MFLTDTPVLTRKKESIFFGESIKKGVIDYYHENELATKMTIMKSIEEIVHLMMIINSVIKVQKL
ncbi:hypothetical protein JFT70_16565 [Bacillus sp. TH11]|nr:hypothetical protein [Bacillus sp. TH11]